MSANQLQEFTRSKKAAFGVSWYASQCKMSSHSKHQVFIYLALISNNWPYVVTYRFKYRSDLRIKPAIRFDRPKLLHET
jgi:hypothetical protein